MVLALKRGNVVKLILCWIVFSDVEGQSFNQVTGEPQPRIRFL